MSGVKVFGYVDVKACACGIQFWGFYTPLIRHDIVTNKRVLILDRVPVFLPKYNRGHQIEILERLMEDEVPVIFKAYQGETRSGLHWVKLNTSKLNTSYDIGLISCFAPAEFLKEEVWDVEWTEDTPAGMVVYRACIEPIYDQFTTVETIFLSTLRKLVKEGKAEIVEETETAWIFKVTDEELKKVLREQELCDEEGIVRKQKVPKKVRDDDIIVLPL